MEQYTDEQLKVLHEVNESITLFIAYAEQLAALNRRIALVEAVRPYWVAFLMAIPPRGDDE